MAIKVQGTTIIDDSKVLSNVSSVDSTTANSISSALQVGTPAPLTVTSVTASSNQTTFPVNYKSGNISVYLNGSRLADSDDYTATSGTAVVLTTGATSNDLVEIVEHGAAFASPYAANIYTANGSSPFNSGNTTLTASYTKGKEAVYVNGVKFLSGTDYTTNNAGDTITFLSALSSGDLVEVVEHGALANSSFTDLTDTPSSLGTAGQVAQINSAGNAIEFADPGTKTVANITELEALTSSEGDMAFVTGTNGLFIKKTAGWYKIATVANDQLQSVTVTMSGGGTAADPYELALDGTDTTATGAATDPEGLSVTWSVAATSANTSISGNNIVVSSVTVATITQGTGASSNVFTIDPVATTGTHNFSLRFSVTDGINATINTDKDYILNFVTTVLDSKHTTLLAQAVGANNGTNSSITDSHSSSSPHTFTNTGTPVAGTLSPYRAGGYSLFFDGTNDALTIPQTSNVGNFGTGEFTVELWFKPTNEDVQMMFVDFRTSVAGLQISRRGSNTIRVRSGGTTLITGSTLLTDLNTWYHVCVHRNSSNELKLFVNGTQEGGTITGHTDNYTSESSGNWNIAQNYTGGTRINGYITDFRVTHGQAITPPSGGPTERLTASTNTKFLYSGTGYIGDTHNSVASNNHTISLVGAPETRQFGPYDSSEYDAADNGGSIYFPVDTGTRLSSASSSLELGTGNFTIEGWLYHNLDGATGSSYCFDYRTPPNSGSVHPFLYIENSVFKYGYGAYSQKITSGTVVENTWYHWAVCRSGTNTKLFLNGKQVGSTFTGDNINYQGQQPYIGRHNNVSSLSAKGYLSDVRITKSDLYTADFTPPTAPLASTNSVLHMKGADGSIIDKSGSDNLVLHGNTKCTTTSVVYNSNTVSSKSIYFDGSGDYIDLPLEQKIGTADFTIEGWVNFSAVTNNRAVFGIAYTGGAYLEFYLRQDGASNSLAITGVSGGFTVFSNTTCSTNTWYHFALVRSGTTGTVYLNGTSKGTVGITNNATGTIRLGTYDGSNSMLQGYLQDVRVSVGKARHTGNFNPPTALHEG